MSSGYRLAITFIFLSAGFTTSAQDQMVFLRHDQVIARFSPGDFIRVKLKNKSKVDGKIVEFTEFTVITTTDTIPVNKILHIRNTAQKRSFGRGIGGLLFMGGVVLISVELLNTAFGYAKHVDENVAKTSAILAGAGTLLILASPRYTKVKPGVTIRIIDYKSRFYR